MFPCALVRLASRTVGPHSLSGNSSIHRCTSAVFITRRHGHNVKAPDVPWKIYHPHLQEPERKVRVQGSLKGPARFIPNDFRHQQYIESLRSGEYTGPDWPYNFLGGTFWKERRYNAKYNPIPADVSSMTGVMFLPKQNCWSVEWEEQQTQRIRWFKASYGHKKGQYAAENFRRLLVQAGRVDNRRTERQIRVAAMAGRAQRNLRKKKFLNKDARRLGNSGSYLGNVKKTREDYKGRGLLS